ncbi:MAG TPA: hydantoinase B/oxoprolinase family protein [Dehalococcoidales bacterium]|nr:hydantoinase B/oxoprolinase family protein [Dehalococcoidales bacterium]
MPGAIDYEIGKRLHPEPPTDEELEFMKDIEPTSAGIFLHKLHTIASEGNETLVKLGASTGCRWGDTACAIYTRSGDSAVCASGLYFHSVLGSTDIKYIMKYWLNDPSVGVKPGDAFFCNSPYIRGTHPPDMGIYAPIFYKGKLICWIGAVVHTGECGACEPGGMPTGSRSMYDEGLQVPALKIAENYRLKEDVINYFNHMVRDPRAMTLDIKARMACLRVVEKRLTPVIEKYSPEYTVGILRYVIKLTGEATRMRISTWNDGKYSFVQFIDAVGVLHRLTKVAVTLEKKGDHLYFDYDGTSPEVMDRVANSPGTGVIGVNTVYLLGHLFYDLPHNSGILEPMSFKMPDGTIVNASRESPKAGCAYVHEAGSLAVQYVLQNLVYAASPERTECAGNRGFDTLSYGGVNQYGESFADAGAEMNGIGFGARSYKDGVDVAGAYFAPMTSEPGEVESLESHLPFLYLYRGFHQDSCGHGKYRGGVGMDYAVKIHAVPSAALGTWGFGSKITLAQGLFGGYGVPALPFLAISKSNMDDMLRNTDANIPNSARMLYHEQAIKGHYNLRGYPCVAEPTREGDLVAGGTGGGGGYGDPIERDPSKVMKDLETGTISHWAAKNVYKVVYDEKRLAVDEEKTKALREQERKDRKTRGKKFAQFEKEWLKKKPSDETLEFYGSWPTPKYESFSYFGDWSGYQQK